MRQPEHQPLDSDPSSERKPERLASTRQLRKRQLALVLADAALAEVFFVLALGIGHSIDLGAGIAGPASRPLAGLLAVLFPVIVASRGLYRLGRFPSRRRQAMAGLRAVLWSIGLGAAALFLFAREIPWSLRSTLILYHALLAIWMVLVRPWISVSLQKHLLRSAVHRKVLIFGSGAPLIELARALRRNRRGTDVLACADQPNPGCAWPYPFYPCELEETPDLARDLGVDLVLLARPDIPREQVVRISDRLLEQGCEVRVARNMFMRLIDSIPIETVGGFPLLPVGETPLTGSAERAKRTVDLAAICVGAIFALPLLLLLALLVRLSSPGPILYRQIRVGRNGQHFVFYKFRSMRVAPEDPVHQQYASSLVAGEGEAVTGRDGHKVYKLVDDSRVTPIGRFLRRTSLDELPQLLNVFRGEMSLVGPRPCLPFEWQLYKDWQKRRLAVTPGMTGLWQVTGRSYVTFEDMVLLDLFYIANWSFAVDVRLLLRTVPVMIFGKGGV